MSVSPINCKSHRGRNLFLIVYHYLLILRNNVCEYISVGEPENEEQGNGNEYKNDILC